LIKIEEFIEQALYYSKSNNTEEDYIVREFHLKTVINDVIKKNSKYFIQKRISLQMDDLDGTLFSDIKWVQFILNQIIINALNYSKSDTPMIKISAKKNDNNITLSIEDNGVGISEKDLPMIFNKGFTGSNGRVNKRSTGMGLYLCKKLCGKLGLAIEVTSVINAGTTVNVIFPKSKMMLLE
jgi:signal transduction histidine kinase